jgi:hypothetical protein
MDRKYRQRGYMDSKSESRDRKKPPPRESLTTEERIQKRSLRHAIDREAKEVVRCHNCGRAVEAFGTIEAETQCPHCRTPLHCCRTCTHFDSAARWQCRAEIAEAVGDKNKANQCAEYHPRLVLDVTGRRSGTPKSNDPKSQFENLFKRS